MPRFVILIGWLTLNFLWSVSTGIGLVLFPVSDTQIFANLSVPFIGALVLILLLITIAAKLGSRPLFSPKITWFIFGTTVVSWLGCWLQQHISGFMLAWLWTGIWIWFGTSQQCFHTLTPSRSFLLLWLIPLVGLSAGCLIGWFLWIQFTRSFHVM